MNTLVALSPHLDDAAFSAGGTLARHAALGWRVIVVTVFTGNVPQPTGFALACQLDKGLGAEVDYMALRRQEDRAACAALGVRALHLPFLEAPHRGYDSAKALFAGVRPEDDVRERLDPALARLLARLRPTRVLAPAAIGNHVDHLHVRAAAQACVAGEQLGWWADWPYYDRAQTLPSGAEAFALSEEERARKLEACLAYASQLGFQFGGPEALRERLRSSTQEFFFDAPPATSAGLIVPPPPRAAGGTRVASGRGGL